MSAIKSVIGLLTRWQLVLFLAVTVSASSAFVGYIVASNPKPVQLNQTPASISVSKGASQKLSSNTVTSDIPPAAATSSGAVSSPVQTQPSNPGESSSQPIQSNLNINDSSVSSNPLVESLLDNQNQ